MKLHEVISTGGRRQTLRAKFYTLLHLLVFLIACPGSLAFAAEKQTHTATIKSPVYWVSRSDLEAAKDGWQIKPGRRLIYEMERKGSHDEKKTTRTLWHI